MANLDVNSRLISPPISEPSSPSSALDFPDTTFSSSVKRMLPQSEIDQDESLAEKPKAPLHKTVRFSPMASVKDTLSRHDMSIPERCNYWIQDHEFEAIRQRNKTRSRGAKGSHDNNDELRDQNQCMDRVEQQINNGGCFPYLEIELHEDRTGTREKRCPAIKDDFYVQADIFYSKIFEDDAFAGIYFSEDGDC
eukprot:CAMPEP_0116116290 /NCGR_PEP_ID=MMETSP0329-20121206/957_1 /TAXON_ID=697910 /ORGANISM="Pseudo-nitzschia arenysensis, Strain B593" /LENGTH=193 /DNA_ID=CAMNT_0003609771 /DNA_START=55 /DNA_END=636 /DNA_ORIENTATION=+